MEKELETRLRALWREVDALGGTHAKDNDYEAGYCQGVLQASIKLEEAGFSEGQSDAADTIESLRSTITSLESKLEIEKAENLRIHHEKVDQLDRAIAAESKLREVEAREAVLRTALSGLKDTLNSEEGTMRHWDSWRKLCVELPGASLPRDAFEGWRDDLVDTIDAALTSAPSSGVSRVIEAAIGVKVLIDVLAEWERKYGALDAGLVWPADAHALLDAINSRKEPGNGFRPLSESLASLTPDKP